MKHLKEYRKSKRYYYFRKQKRLGLVLVIVSVISAIILNGDITVLLLTGPMGLYMMFTKDMVVYDDYYEEVQMKKGIKKDED